MLEEQGIKDHNPRTHPPRENSNHLIPPQNQPLDRPVDVRRFDRSRWLGPKLFKPGWDPQNLHRRYDWARLPGAFTMIQSPCSPGRFGKGSVPDVGAHGRLRLLELGIFDDKVEGLTIGPLRCTTSGDTIHGICATHREGRKMTPHHQYTFKSVPFLRGCRGVSRFLWCCWIECDHCMQWVVFDGLSF